jgi:hypothetical protein
VEIVRHKRIAQRTMEIFRGRAVLAARAEAVEDPIGLLEETTADGRVGSGFKVGSDAPDCPT